MNSAVSILLIEDNPGDQLIVKKHLAQSESPEFEVTLTTSFEQAKQSLLTSCFDTILLDLTLPDSDGLETFFELYNLASDTPIIILTGLDVQELAAQAVREGAQDYLVKGEHLNVLLIRSILYGIERRHRLSQELELARTQVHMQTMQTFMQDVTHDLKTPLSVIITSGQLLSHYVSLDNPKVVKHLQNIMNQSDRLKHMINSILELSQLTLIDEIATDDLYRFDLGVIIKKITEDLSELAASREIKLYCDVEYPINLYASEEMLIRLLNNLIYNAITHTPPKGQVWVELDKVESQAIIKVNDTGVGIPDDSIPHVFDRFYRVDKSRESSTGNSGLGLSIVQRIVELHYGHIEVESEVDKGTQFKVTLPISSDENQRLLSPS